MKVDFEFDRVAGRSAAVPDAAANPSELLRRGIFGFSPHDRRAWPFFQLRSHLRNILQQGGHRMLAITSVQPGDGKTFVAANLAAAMSAIHPTVLVDLDLRRSALTQRLGLCSRKGIDDYLGGEAAWHETGTRLHDHQLTVHGVRVNRADAAARIASRRFDDIARIVRTLPGDPICILDSPPVLVCDEVVSIGRVADAVLLVVDEGRTSRAALVEATRLLSPTPIIGSVLNRSIAGARNQRGYDDYYAPPR